MEEAQRPLGTLIPVSSMSWEIDCENLKDWDNPEDYCEEYLVDVDDDELERILEGADGRMEVHGDILTRYLPDCSEKAYVTALLIGKWYNFLKHNFSVGSGTNGIRFAGRRTVVAPDMNILDRVNRPTPPENRRQMMREGQPAPNWCLQVAFQSETNQRNKGFNKVQNLFSYRGAGDTTVDEVWLLVFPKSINLNIQVPNLNDPPLPVIPLSVDRPACEAKYIAIFVRNLNPEGDMHYINDPERPFLVGYYLLEPNMIFQVPPYSLLSGAPDILSNCLLHELGYEIEHREQA